MTNEELKTALSAVLPSLVFEEGSEWTTAYVEPAQWPMLAMQLKEDEGLFLNYLFCLTCVDWKTHLTMVYHLSSMRYHHQVVIKSKLSRENGEIGSVSRIWRTAEFHEREVFELFGVHFTNHPDLRKLILPDDFEGYPLRKDFEDPVNMIRL